MTLRELGPRSEQMGARRASTQETGRNVGTLSGSGELATRAGRADKDLVWRSGVLAKPKQREQMAAERD